MSDESGVSLMRHVQNMKTAFSCIQKGIKITGGVVTLIKGAWSHE